MRQMPAIPESTRSSIILRLLDHAEKNWPQLRKNRPDTTAASLTITGVLPGGEQIPLFRLRYGGSAHSFGSAIYSAARGRYEDAVANPASLAHPEEALDTACTVHLAGLGHEPAPNPRATTVSPTKPAGNRGGEVRRPVARTAAPACWVRRAARRGPTARSPRSARPQPGPAGPGCPSSCRPSPTCCCVLIPIVDNLILSFEQMSPATISSLFAPFAGIANYKAALVQTVTQSAIVRTFTFTFLSLLFQFVIGFAVALLFNLRFPLRRVARSLIIIPWLLPLLITGFIFKFPFQAEATGQLKPLDSEPGFTNSGYVKGAITECTYQGKQYCFPIGTNTVGLFYNKAMLAVAHVSPPTTWAELQSDAKALTTGNTYGIAFDATADEQSTWQLEPFFWSQGGNLDSVSTPAFQKSLQLWVNMVKDGSASKSVLQWGQDPDLTEQFLHKTAAMIEDGPWIFPALNAAGWKYNSSTASCRSRPSGRRHGGHPARRGDLEPR